MKNFIRKYISDLFINKRGYAILIICVLLFLFRFFLVWLGNIPFFVFAVTLLLFFSDYFFLFINRQGVFAVRTNAERFSNGDENHVRIDVENFYSFPVSVEVIDEIPVQFQQRNILFNTKIGAKESKIINYDLRPVKRGEYEFGTVNVYAISPISFVKRRFRLGMPVTVPVYPSYLQMRKYQLMAISNRLSEVGVKKIRRIGHSMEFEQIKEYVLGDDYRTLNWKATARRGQLMVNHYTDEKSQQIYCVIDKGRIMKMPFDGVSLLDYAINASLVLCNVALLKQDKAGLITFSEQVGAFLPIKKLYRCRQFWKHCTTKKRVT